LTLGSRLASKGIVLAAVCAAILAGAPVASNAAELGRFPWSGERYVRTSDFYWNWRERCAYAGYYCLYAEYGYVYHYPFDDRPIAYRHYRRRYR
jgi:hypothetical protein